MNINPLVVKVTLLINTSSQAGKMAQQITALVATSDDLNPRTHMCGRKELTSSGCLLMSQSHILTVTCTHTYPYTHNK